MENAMSDDYTIDSLEQAALKRLTEERHASGSLDPEVEKLLASSGIYWDEIGKEYFILDTFLSEVNRSYAMTGSVVS